MNRAVPTVDYHKKLPINLSKLISQPPKPALMESEDDDAEDEEDDNNDNEVADEEDYHEYHSAQDNADYFVKELDKFTVKSSQK